MVRPWAPFMLPYSLRSEAVQARVRQKRQRILYSRSLAVAIMLAALCMAVLLMF